jgi:hypothetical protein
MNSPVGEGGVNVSKRGVVDSVLGSKTGDDIRVLDKHLRTNVRDKLPRGLDQ